MNSQDTYNYLTTTNINGNSTGPAYLTSTIIGTSTDTISSIANTGSSYGLSTDYRVSIPNGEVTLDELNKAMKILSNAVDHVKTKMAVMESIEEKSKCKPRKLNI